MAPAEAGGSPRCGDPEVVEWKGREPPSPPLDPAICELSVPVSPLLLLPIFSSLILQAPVEQSFNFFVSVAATDPSVADSRAGERVAADPADRGPDGAGREEGLQEGHPLRPPRQAAAEGRLHPAQVHLREGLRSPQGLCLAAPAPPPPPVPIFTSKKERRACCLIHRGSVCVSPAGGLEQVQFRGAVAASLGGHLTNRRVHGGSIFIYLFLGRLPGRAI